MPLNPMVCELPQTAGETDRAPGTQIEGGAIAFRGRAATKLAPDAPKFPWDSFDCCPHKTLDAPARVHLDHLGHLHLCQGLTMGSLFDVRLTKIVESYAPSQHPIVDPLLKGGPAQLVKTYDLPHEEEYADACHLCYEARAQLRQKFPQYLAPEQAYGE